MSRRYQDLRHCICAGSPGGRVWRRNSWTTGKLVVMIRSVAVLGAGVMGAQIAAHFANAGVPALLLDVTAEAAAAGTQARTGAQARSVLHAGHLEARHDRRLRSRAAAKLRESRLDHRGGRRAARRQARTARAASMRRAGLVRSSARTRRAFRSPRSPKAAATTSGGTGWARTSSTRRAICGCSR